MKLRALFLLPLILSAACGFHLRGSQLAKIDIDNIYIKDSGAPGLARAVRMQLQAMGTILAEARAQASHIVILSDETLERKLLSVNARTGKAEEYELVLTAKISIEKNDGTVLANNESLQIARDFTYDEDAVLGKFTEQKVIEQELLRRGASRVLRRVQIITSNAAE